MPSHANKQVNITQNQNTPSVPRFIIRTMQDDLNALKGQPIKQIIIEPRSQIKTSLKPKPQVKTIQKPKPAVIQQIQPAQQKPEIKITQTPKTATTTAPAPKEPERPAQILQKPESSIFLKQNRELEEMKIQLHKSRQIPAEQATLIQQLKNELNISKEENITLNSKLEQQNAQSSKLQAFQIKIQELTQKSAQASAQAEELKTNLNTKDLVLQKTEQENISLKNSLSQLQQEDEQIKTKISGLQTEKTQLNNIITSLQTEISQLRQSLEQKPIKQAEPIVPPAEKKSFKIPKQKIILGFVILILLASLTVLVYSIIKNSGESSEPITPIEPDKPQIPIIKIETPKSLIPVEKTLILDIEQNEDTLNQIKKFLEQNQPLPRISQLALRRSDKFINLKELLSSLKISIPTRIENNLANLYTLLVFTQEGNNLQLGLVLQTKNTLPVLAELSYWQKNMIYDLRSLFISNNISETEKFLINNREYPNIIIHFQDTADLNNSLHYAIVKNNLIITPSQNSFKTILNTLLSQPVE